MSRGKDTHKDSEGHPVVINPEPAEATVPETVKPETSSMSSKTPIPEKPEFLEQRHRKMVEVERAWVTCMTTKMSPNQIIQQLQAIIEKPSEEF